MTNLYQAPQTHTVTLPQPPQPQISRSPDQHMNVANQLQAVQPDISQYEQVQQVQYPMTSQSLQSNQMLTS